MDYGEEDKMVMERLAAAEHTCEWEYDPGDPSVGIAPGWYCNYYNELLGVGCDAELSDAEIEEIEADLYARLIEANPQLAEMGL